jgi:hypothetical protein
MQEDFAASRTLSEQRDSIDKTVYDRTCGPDLAADHRTKIAARPTTRQKKIIVIS